MTDHKWNPLHEAELDRILASRQPQEAAKVASLSPNDRARYQGLLAAASDIMAIFWVYIHGFNHLQQEQPASSTIHGHILHWVHQNAGRSPRRIAGMVATNLCSVLEEFLGDIAAAKLTPAVIQRLPRTYIAGLHTRGRDMREIRKAILRSVKPSVRADGAHWASSISTVFALSLDPATEETLRSMIYFRNAYIHEPGKVMGADSITGEEMTSWGKSVLLLAYDVALHP